MSSLFTGNPVVCECLWTDSGLLLEGVSEAIQNEAKERKGAFLSMLLVTLGTRLLSNILAVKGIIRTREGFLRAGYGSSIKNKNF